MRTSLRTSLCLSLLLCAPLAAAQSEQRLATGDTVRWHRSRVPFVVDASMYEGASIREPARLVDESAAAWFGNGHVPRFEVTDGALGEPGYDPRRDDNVSGIALYRSHFPQRFDRAVLALTLLTRNSATGEIVDADIIIDAERNRFAELSGPELLGVFGAPNDYRNVITHEFGHVLGLVEDPDHPESTMYPSSPPGEVTKRALSPVDRASAARAYAAAPTLVEDFVGGCGGAARVAPRAGTHGALALSLVGLSAVVLLARRRRAQVVFFGLSAVGLALAAPAPSPVDTGLVLSSRCLRVGGVLVTRARVQTDHGVLSVERVGGRLDGFEQRVLDAPSGTALTPGARVELR